MHFVYQFSESEDPTLLSAALWWQKISHQVVFNQGHNELWILDLNKAPEVEAVLSVWKEDASQLVQYKPHSQTSSSTSSLGVQFKNTPITILLIALTLLVAAATQLGADLNVISHFTITPFELKNGSIYFYDLSEVMARHEYWRLFSPALLHFSVMHIVFNLLWVWDIGRKLEYLLGSVVWSSGVVIVAVASNVVQYEIDGYPLFGGLSGVVYGLIGFAWLLPLLNKRWPTIVSKQLMVFFIIWLGVGYTPFPEMIGIGSIANTAHSIGLLTGLLLGSVYWLITKCKQAL